MLILQNPEIFLDHLHNFATGHHTVISGKWRGHVQLNDGGIVAILPGREALIVGPTLAVPTDQIAILPWVVGPVSVHDLRCHPTASTPFVPLTHEVVQARNPGLQKAGVERLCWNALGAGKGWWNLFVHAACDIAKLYKQILASACVELASA